MPSFHHAEFPADRLRAERVETVSVCVPAREEAATIAGVVAPLMALREAGVVDQVVVLDDDSRDGTGAIAAALGAEVVRPAALLPGFGPVLGKGDAMWRALTVLTGDLVCFVDADSEDFGAHFATGLLGPLVCVPGVSFVKGFYRRPFKSAEAGCPDRRRPGDGADRAAAAGGVLSRARGASASRWPASSRRGASCSSGWRSAPATRSRWACCSTSAADSGIGALAQVDLDSRQNRHQSIDDLAPMAAAVLAAVTSRLRRDGRLLGAGAEREPLERPPLAELRALRVDSLP